MSDAAMKSRAVSTHDQISSLIRQSCWLLDTEKLKDWVDLFSEEGEYEVVSYSSELDKEMRWWHSSKSQLAQLFKDIQNHIRENAQRAHMVMEISIVPRDDDASALSRFTVFKTNQDGSTHVYVVGHYEDEFSRIAESWKFKKRRVVLDTRLFDVFPHIIPL